MRPLREKRDYQITMGGHMYTILVVDDNLAIVDLIALTLEQGGYRVLRARGGEEALALLKKARPDLILLDIVMEPMDGWETLKKIKSADPPTASIPVMIMTVKHLTLEAAEEFGPLIEDYINKPVFMRELYDAIEYFFHHRDNMEVQMQIAAKLGAPAELTDEYVTLSRTTDVQKRLIEILLHARTSEYFTPERRQEFVTAIALMQAAVNEKMGRIEEIKAEFEKIGVKV
jgi:two-component system OmpR family response regulator